MNCSSAEALFEKYLDGELSSVRRDRFSTHVDRCTACRSLFEELRVVDALLLEPRQIELAPNFTFATMAEAHSLGSPVRHRAPVGAYLVAYLAAAWLIAGTVFVFAPQLMHTLADTVLAIARSIVDASGALGSVVSRVFSRGGSFLTALLGALLALDVLLVAGFGWALKYARPRLVERLRS